LFDFIESGDNEPVIPLATQVLDSDSCRSPFSPSNVQRESRRLRFVDVVTSAK